LEDGNSGLGHPGIEPKSLRLTEQHFPELIPSTDKKERWARQQAASKEIPCDNGEGRRLDTITRIMTWDSVWCHALKCTTDSQISRYELCVVKGETILESV
jgi:hypothetical protein